MKRVHLVRCTSIVIGTLLIALGINLFLLPHKLSTGGVSGIGTVLVYLFNVPVAVTNILINALLFFIGFRCLGTGKWISSVIGVVLLTVFLLLTSLIKPISCDVFTALIAGSVLVGAGIGLVIRQGASTGGSDLVALMVNKRMPHIGVARIIFVTDAAVVVASGAVLGGFQITVYSLCALYIASRISDWILVLGESGKSVYIFSEQYKSIAQGILFELGRGVTALDAHGMYSEKESRVLLCAVTPKELPQLVTLVRRFDEKAFLIINDVHKILGEGFKNHLTI